MELSKEELAKKFGQRVKDLRKQRGISQADLARRCEKPSQHIELVENGKVSANLFTVYTIALALDVTLAELMDQVDT